MTVGLPMTSLPTSMSTGVSTLVLAVTSRAIGYTDTVTVFESHSDVPSRQPVVRNESIPTKSPVGV